MKGEDARLGMMVQYNRMSDRPYYGTITELRHNNQSEQVLVLYHDGVFSGQILSTHVSNIEPYTSEAE